MRRALPVIAAALTSLALASCSGTEDSAQEATPTTVTSTVTAPADDPPQTTESPAPGNDGDVTTQPPATTPPPADCGISPSSDAITAPISTLEPPSAPNTAWAYEGDSDYDRCADLSYALLVQRPQGNSQFGTQILFFHHGEYIGIDSTYPQQAMNIEDKDNALVVTYKDWEALDDAGGSNAESPNYTATVTFFWDEATNQLGTEGTFPNQGL